MALIGILFAGCSRSSSARRSATEARYEEQTGSSARSADDVDRLAEDLRQAYSGADGISPIESASATQIQFLSPDRQTAVPPAPARLPGVGYQLRARGATSTDTDGEPWDIPALGEWNAQFGSVVSTNVFTYLDANGAATVTAAQVQTVVIQVTVATKTSRNRQFTYKTSVTLRADI